jgi:hypothetical protein
VKRLLAGALALLGLHCASAPATAPVPVAVAPEAGFLEVPARDVTLAGAPVSIAATGRLFYSLRTADADPAGKPILILFNGFADDIVRPYGTGPMTVAEGGAVVANPSSFTRFANLVYVEPRQAGYSYDVRPDGAPPAAADCAPTLFNEYVDAADVLLAVLAFLEAHPELTGPVYWLGESFGGVRVTWILAYLRGRFDLAHYADPVLAQRLAAVTRAGSLHAGQILLEGWLGGLAQDEAIQAECADPVEIAAVAAATGTACTDACKCTTSAGNSLYNFAYTTAQQGERVLEADAAHTTPDRAAALLGLPLTAIPLLAGAERAKGFKCSPPDDTVPPQDALVAALGALPAGQAYYVPYSPLLPGKETAPTTADWYSQDYEAVAFVDNLREVPAFLTRGDHDLVVPTRSLAPALRAVVGAAQVDTSAAARIGVVYPDGPRFVDVFDYPTAGHMISMMAPAQLATDLWGWLGAHP